MKIFRLAFLSIVLSLSHQQVHAVNFNATDPYQILEVPRNVDEKTLKNVYREAGMKYHPDKNKDDPLATKKMQTINDAHRKVLDERKAAAWKSPPAPSSAPAQARGTDPSRAQVEATIRGVLAETKTSELLMELDNYVKEYRANPLFSQNPEFEEVFAYMATQEIVERNNPNAIAELKRIVLSELAFPGQSKSDLVSHISYSIVKVFTESKGNTFDDVFIKLAGINYNDVNSKKSPLVRELIARALIQRINDPKAAEALGSMVGRSANEEFKQRYKAYMPSSFAKCFKTNLANMFGKK